MVDSSDPEKPPFGNSLSSTPHGVTSARDSELASIVGKLKEAGLHTIIYGLGSVLQTALGLILLPLYTSAFTPAEYGVFSLVLLTGTVAGAVFYLGASSALSRSYFDYDSDADRRAVVSTALSITVVGAATQILLAFALAPALSRALFATDGYSVQLTIALATSAVTFINNLFVVVLRFQRRSVAVVILNLSTLVVSTSLIYYLLVVRRLGLTGPLVGLLIGQLFQCGAMLVMVRRSLAPRISRAELRLQLAFGIPSLAAGLLYYVLDSVDRLFIAHFGSLEQVGIYSLGYRVAMVIHVLLVLPFAQIWAPMRMEYQHHTDAKRLFSLVLTYYFIIGTAVMIGVSLFAPEIVGLLGRQRAFQPGWRVIPIVMTGHLIYGSLTVTDYGIVLARQIRFYVYGLAVALIVNLVLNYVFVPRFGYMAAAVNTLITYVVLFALVTRASNRLFHISWELSRIALVFAIAGPIILIGTQIGAGTLRAVLVKLALLGVVALLWYRVVLERWEQRQLAGALTTFTR